MAAVAFARTVVPKVELPEVDGTWENGVAKFARFTAADGKTAVLPINDKGEGMPALLRRIGLLPRCAPGPNYKPQVRSRSNGPPRHHGAADGWGDAAGWKGSGYTGDVSTSEAEERVARQVGLELQELERVHWWHLGQLRQ